MMAATPERELALGAAAIGQRRRDVAGDGCHGDPAFGKDKETRLEGTPLREAIKRGR
jgi:hypothetical protein